MCWKATVLWPKVKCSNDMKPNRQINWLSLSKSLGVKQGVVGTAEAKKAIASLIGNGKLNGAVDCYVKGKPGCELARSVLWLLQPPSAMERCYELFKKSQNIEVRRSAVELLRVLADRRALKWIPGFLRDPDPAIQLHGSRILDQLLWSKVIGAKEAKSLIGKCAVHPAKSVRDVAAVIKKYLK